MEARLDAELNRLFQVAGYGNVIIAIITLLIIYFNESSLDLFAIIPVIVICFSFTISLILGFVIGLDRGQVKKN